MLKKPNLTAEEKNRLKNEILDAIGGDKRLTAPANFSATIKKKTTPEPALQKLPTSAIKSDTKSIINAVAKPAIKSVPKTTPEPIIKPIIEPENDKSLMPADKLMTIISKKTNQKKSAPKNKSFVVIPEVKFKVRKDHSDHSEKHRIKQGLSMLRFIIFLLVIIAVLLTVNVLLLGIK